MTLQRSHHQHSYQKTQLCEYHRKKEHKWLEVSSKSQSTCYPQVFLGIFQSMYISLPFLHSQIHLINLQSHYLPHQISTSSYSMLSFSFQHFLERKLLNEWAIFNFLYFLQIYRLPHQHYFLVFELIQSCRQSSRLQLIYHQGCLVLASQLSQALYFALPIQTNLMNSHYYHSSYFDSMVL